MTGLKDKVASYVIDYPRFDESANEVADLILDVVINEAITAIKQCPQGQFISVYVKAIEDLKRPT